MKNLILFLILLSSINLFSQENKEIEEMNEALKLLNNIRVFSQLEPLKLDERYNELALRQARKKAFNIYTEIDSIGESYYFQGVDLKIPVNYYNAVLGLTLKEEWIDEDAYRQIKCKTCTLVGFGKAKNDNNEYIFIVFDSVE